jgi:hypothetical protein
VEPESKGEALQANTLLLLPALFMVNVAPDGSGLFGIAIKIA